MPLFDKQIAEMAKDVRFGNLRVLNLRNCYDVTIEGFKYLL